MSKLRTWWIGLALAAGFGVVLAGPAWLLWHAIEPELGDRSSLEARFDSVWVEQGTVVFSYALRNRTSREARLLPAETAVNVLQAKDRPPLGYAVMRLPLELAAHASQQVEVRLEVPDVFWGPLRSAPAAGAEAVAQFLHDALRELEGFELVNEAEGIRIRFPRGW
jgi:hypothetical protein